MHIYVYVCIYIYIYIIDDLKTDECYSITPAIIIIIIIIIIIVIINRGRQCKTVRE